ncbi:MAG: hypothetical protein IPM42_07655 [Saprospiraceae bacterium]|nr:hypothetical protein [Saprospiraceae bacterium]
MHTSDQKFKDYWEKILLQGRWRYALINGSIFGFGIFIIINLFNLKDSSFSDVYLTRKALDQLATMILAGIIGYGSIKWWLNNNIYKKILKRAEEASEQK